MLLTYKNVDLEIYINGLLLDFNINKDINIELSKDTFNNSISKLSQKHNCLEYWLMSLSERNTLVHSLFLDICKIELINELLPECGNIEIFTNNIVIYTYFKKIALVGFQDRLRFEFKKLVQECKPYFQLFKFLFKKIIFTIRYKNKKLKTDLSNAIIIQTWVGDDNFKDGVFNDSYYGNLANYLKKSDKKVITWPIFYNVKSDKKAVEFIRKNNDIFLLIEDYLKMSDYFFSISLFFKKRFLKIGEVKVGSNDFTTVFKHYQNKEIVGYSDLVYSFTKRLNELNVKNATFLLNHENMVPEKALILGVRKFLQDSKIVGYFHTTKPSNQLCLEYANNYEYRIAPKPDVIIFNSNEYKKYYEDKYKNIKTFNGVAFKQLHLKNNTKSDFNTDEILVLFSGVGEEVKLMFSLLSKVKNSYKFLFRMHPLNRFNVAEFYQYKNYKIVNEESIDELLSKSKKIISTYSATALESALRGIEVGLIYDKRKLLFNPFDNTNINNYQLILNNLELEDFLNKKSEVCKFGHFFNLDEKHYNVFLEVI